MKIKKASPAYRAAMVGILAAEAVALSFLESLLPPLTFLPPGAKLGLANIVVMFSVVSAGLPAALAVILIKSLFTLITRGLSAFFISLCGGLLSGLVMCLLTRGRGEKTKFGYIGVSVLSAVAHNIGQLAAASILSGTALFSYLPFLIIFGILFGSVTGIVLGIVMPVLRRQSSVFHKKLKKEMQGEENETKTA